MSKDELLAELKVRIASSDPGMAQVVAPGASVESTPSRAARHRRYVELWREANAADEGDAVLERIRDELKRH